MPSIYIFIKLILYYIVKKYGKISYDGFNAAGFVYNSEKDIFYSTQNAWQKNFGYTHLYDVLAPLFQMIIDTEQIKFYYDNKNWLICFWKGQYTILTGAEIGLYYTNEKKVNNKTLYLPVSDKEMLQMDLVLSKNNDIIAKVNAKHWWLAAFKLGMFSKPKELSMDIKLTFPNQDMLNAFLESFKKLKYSPNDYTIQENTFYFKFKKPKSPKVWTKSWLTDNIRQIINRKKVNTYNKYLSDFIDNNKINDTKSNKKVIIINDFIPNILKNNPINKEEISKKIFSVKEENIVFLNNKVSKGPK